MRKARVMDGMSISNAATNIIHTQTPLDFASEPIKLLFFCIRTVYKVQHTWHSCLLCISSITLRQRTHSHVPFYPPPWARFNAFLLSYANPLCCSAQCLVIKWAHDVYGTETLLWPQQFGVFHIKQAQAAASDTPRSCSCSKMLLTDKQAAMPFVNLYSYVFQPVLHGRAGANTVPGSSRQRWFKLGVK